jgi:hypothetical protein
MDWRRSSDPTVHVRHKPSCSHATDQDLRLWAFTGEQLSSENYRKTQERIAKREATQRSDRLNIEPEPAEPQVEPEPEEVECGVPGYRKDSEVVPLTKAERARIEAESKEPDPLAREVVQAGYANLKDANGDSARLRLTRDEMLRLSKRVKKVEPEPDGEIDEGQAEQNALFLASYIAGYAEKLEACIEFASPETLALLQDAHMRLGKLIALRDLQLAIKKVDEP